MKPKKAHPDIFKTQCWLQERVTDPYRVLAEMFRMADLNYFRRCIKNLLLFMTSVKVYDKESPGNTLVNTRVLQSVMRAAHALQHKQRHKIKEKTKGSIYKHEHVDRLVTENNWKDFPRSLSQKDFYNPYRVFRNFFKHQSLEEWELTLQRIVENALSAGIGGEESNSLKLFLHLTKLAEAAYLINLREAAHVKTQIKIQP